MCERTWTAGENMCRPQGSSTEQSNSLIYWLHKYQHMHQESKLVLFPQTACQDPEGEDEDDKQQVGHF